MLSRSITVLGRQIDPSKPCFTIYVNLLSPPIAIGLVAGSSDYSPSVDYD